MRHLPIAAGLLAAFALALEPPAAAGQQAATATITGLVHDATSNAPIVAAVVTIPAANRSALTDDAGRFRLELPAGTYTLAVSALGYATLEAESAVEDGGYYRIGLYPNPIALEPVVVDAEGMDRIFQRRRNAAAVSVRTLGPTELTRGGAGNVEEFVKTRLGLVTCPALATGANPAAGMFSRTLAQSLVGSLGCVIWRGRTVPVAVYIDERFALGGVTELAAYLPHDLYAIEVWRYGAEIRVFTNNFIERVTRGREMLLGRPAPPPGGF